MGFLTRREQKVLCVVIGLLLVGWAVRTWRLSQVPTEPVAVQTTPE
ncbi:hypothetical protein G4L39_11430 [Limisphaera ngatamarikiensis]|jgi:hypothetical protein|uniref:Uncharacterized protein n=1 Tax=Limisphaera ngatamarikiensis TaxID=1324935 RepID=A0A6M1RRG7_9BACT|nr:hypothetical protein [Limisphaera ngatamarikiensis]NGO39997.1 hypothetical protein [Limisphaera ngatamarikiensis]